MNLGGTPVPSAICAPALTLILIKIAQFGRRSVTAWTVADRDN